MKALITSLILIIFFSTEAYSQLYQGPANGSVPNGAITNTGLFSLDMNGEPISPYIQKPRNEEEEDIELLPDYLNKIAATGPAGSNYFESSASGSNNNPLILNNFAGSPDPGNTIPPDPYIAAGPTNIIFTTNAPYFYIYDKNGAFVSRINANTWFGNVLSSPSCFDPKISYDHFAKRWIMVWLDQDNASSRGYFLISVSDDSIPMGTWYNWAIKSSLNGSTESGGWGDYQGVGFDQQAIYLTTNQFSFGGSFQGAKTRIIGKAQLYNNTAGPLVWTDLWDIRDPSSSQQIIGHRPSVFYGSAGEYYFLATPFFTTQTYVILYKLTNPLTSPVMTGVTIPVTTNSAPPNANQLGGSTVLIDAGGGNGNPFRNEITFKNGNLFGVRSVASGSGYSSISYLRINPSTNSVVEDAAYGQTGFWHFYPALSVDNNSNVAFTFSRSGLTEYIGAYYTSRLNSDPPGTFTGFTALKTGESNYVKTFGTSRNRWGDYMGMWVDPVDINNIWINTEYASSPANTYATQIGLIRMVPYPNATLNLFSDSLNFGVRELGVTGDTLGFSFANYGSPVLSVSNISVSGSQFQIVNSPSLPLNLNFRDSVYLKVVFNPNVQGNIKDSIRLTSNDPVNPVQTVDLYGKGFVINPAQVNTIYGVTGSQSNGILLTINSSTGVGTSVGASGYSALNGLSIRPSNNVLYSTLSSSPNSELYRVNSNLGDAYFYRSIPISNLRSIAFDINDDLFCLSNDGRFFKYNIQTGDTAYIGNTGIINSYGMSFNPTSGTLWALNVSGNLYKINKLTAAAQTIGSTGITPNTGLTISKTGIAYGISGIGSNLNKLITIDTATGAGTLVGTNIGFSATNGIAISPDVVGIHSISTTIPASFELYQNYPNPFNPSTSIKFDIPGSEKVRLVVFDILGKEIANLVNEKLEAGTYEYYFDASSLSSGVYFYRLEAGSLSFARRMLLLK